jgi:hypothetical protein
MDKSAEIVIQHLKFSPISFIDETINAVNDTLYKSMTELERVVESQLGHEAEKV